jgi:hypothetical protein
MNCEKKKHIARGYSKKSIGGNAKLTYFAGDKSLLTQNKNYTLMNFNGKRS